MNVVTRFNHGRSVRPILAYNQTFVLPSAANPNGSWLTPTAVLQSRFVKISAQFDF